MKVFLLCMCAFVAIGSAHADILTKNATVNMIDKKQDRLKADDVETTGNGAVVTAVTADDGVITVEKSEITLPVGGQTSETRAAIWVM